MQDFENRYNLIVDRISAETANYLNAQKVRDELYTKEEVKANINTQKITVFSANDCLFGAWLDDETVFYSEYEDGHFEVYFSTDGEEE